MEIEQLAEKYNAGASLRELGEIERVDKTTIKRRLEHGGYQLRRSGPIPGKPSKPPLSAEEEARKMKYHHGITIDEFEKIFRHQLGKCAICEKALPSNWNRGVHTDHNYKTGKVRGLLCPSCKKGVDSFNGDGGRLLLAVAYLDRPSLT